MCRRYADVLENERKRTRISTLTALICCGVRRLGDERVCKQQFPPSCLQRAASFQQANGDGLLLGGCSCSAPPPVFSVSLLISVTMRFLGKTGLFQDAALVTVAIVLSGPGQAEDVFVLATQC